MYPMIEHDLAAKVAAGRMTQADADLVVAWLYEYTASHTMKEQRAVTLYRSLVSWVDMLSLSTTSMGPIYQAISAFNDRGYKPNTRRVYLQALRTFLLWRAENGVLPADKVRAIKVPPQDRCARTSADVITKDEYERMIAACRHPRDKAILSVMYEGGLRPVEIRRLRWQDVKFDTYGAILTTSEKTGITRTIRVMAAASYLARMEETVPSHAPDALVFGTKHRRPRPLQRDLLVRVVAEAAKAAGIERKVVPYHFRHSSITHMLEDEIPESVVKLQHWGSLSTQMLATYGHLTHQHVDDVLLTRAGVKQRPTGASERVTPAQCPKCLLVVAPTYQHCPGCGCPLTPEAKERVAVAKASLLENFDMVADFVARVKRGEIDLKE